MTRLFPVHAVMGIHPARGDRQEGCGWESVMETRATEDEEPVVVTAANGAISVSSAAPPGRFLGSAPAGGSLPQRLVPVPQVTSGSECQVTFGVGWQLLGFSGMAKCGILATKGIFLILDQICFLTASMLNFAPTRAEPGHGRTGAVTLAGSSLLQPRGVGADKTLLGDTAPRPQLLREALDVAKCVGKEKFASRMSTSCT